MSRKPPSDTFTRFTSTTPSMSQSQSQSQPRPPPKSQQPFIPQSPKQPTETPQQKVARLRAEHLKRRQAELSVTDRTLAYGRRGADFLHRATTYTLLGFSAVAVVVAAYGFVSLVSHNRTQKRAWIERELDRLEAARAAFLNGTANAEQLHLLEQERAGEEIKARYEEEKRKRSLFSGISNIFKGKGGDMGANSDEMTLSERARKLKDDEMAFARTEVKRVFEKGQELELRPAAIAESGVAGVGLDEKGRPVPMSKMERVPVPQNAALPTPRTKRGGELDQLADNITIGVQSSGSSWWSSIFGSGGRPSPSA